MSEFSKSDPPIRRTFSQKLFAISPRGLFKLILACLGVGILLAVLDVDPGRFWVDFFGTIADAWSTAWSLAGGAVDYLVLGAMIVVPIVVVLRVLDAIRKK